MFPPCILKLDGLSRDQLYLPVAESEPYLSGMFGRKGLLVLGSAEKQGPKCLGQKPSLPCEGRCLETDNSTNDETNIIVFLLFLLLFLPQLSNCAE